MAINENKKTFNFTLRPTIVANAQKRIEKEKKTDIKISLSQVIEDFLSLYGGKKIVAIVGIMLFLSSCAAVKKSDYRNCTKGQSGYVPTKNW